MNKKLIIYSVIFFLLCLLDLSTSSITHIYLSIGFLSFILVRLVFPYIIYFAFISGFIIDLVFYNYVGIFLIILILISLIVYTLKTFYAIKPIFLQFLVLVCFFAFAYLLGKNFTTSIRNLITTIPLAFIWYFIKIPIGPLKNEREQ